MSSEPSPGGARAFALRSGQGAIVLGEHGVRHPRFPRLLGETTTAYRDITHQTVTQRAFRLATRRSVHTFPRALFVDPAAPEALARALVERLGRQPGGARLLDHMWDVEKLSARPQPLRVTPVLVGLCLAVFVLQHLLGPPLFLTGLFSATLLEEGDWWRLVTANLLHGAQLFTPTPGLLGFAHLFLNTLGLLAIGALVERVVGPVRVGWVYGLGAVGGMGAGWWAGHEEAVGASGMVFALVGALVWLELRWGARLPASWRVPRGLLLGALAADAALSLAVPAISGPAHAGGFVAGLVGCAAVAAGAVGRRGLPAWLWVADAAMVAGLAASLAAAAAMLTRGGDPWARHAGILLSHPEVDPLTLNNYAWIIATHEGGAREDLELAVKLARRAVEQTDRRDPNILDTLAETLFQAGRSQEAVEVIEEAIALAPQEEYFREQRRRFTGERPPDDRPAPPERWILPETPGPETPAEPPSDEGIRV